VVIRNVPTPPTHSSFGDKCASSAGDKGAIARLARPCSAWLAPTVIFNGAVWAGRDLDLLHAAVRVVVHEGPKWRSALRRGLLGEGPRCFPWTVLGVMLRRMILACYIDSIAPHSRKHARSAFPWFESYQAASASL
jgi:hypothetical protein